jgi:glutamate:Na+ symporter, ESS family
VDYWHSSVVANALSIGVFLAFAAILRAKLPGWGRLGVPDGITAGAFALLLGPDLLAIAPLDRSALESGVYHGFAVVFIAVGLQAAPIRDATVEGRARGSARSLSFALVALAVLQSLLAFAVLAAWAGITGAEHHPGLGFMVTLGFAQGPGQALSFGSAWEKLGMTDGAQIGLAFAALGFAWCCALGVPLVAYARRRGWIDPLPPRTVAPAAAADEHGLAEHAGVEVRTTSAMEPLTLQLVIIACVYAVVFSVLLGITRLLPAGGSLGATLWGFHFLVGSALAIALRRFSDRARSPLPLHDDLLGRVAVVAVDFTTAAALGAIQLQTLGRYLLPILVLSSLGGLLTLWVSMWLARRAFPEAPFSHALLLYGTGTGTIPTGLALLRMVDPELRGPVARSTVIAATASIPLGAPLFMGVMPLAVSRWSSGFWPSVLLPLAVLAIYIVVLMLLWQRTAWLRWLRPLRSLWPDER